MVQRLGYRQKNRLWGLMLCTGVLAVFLFLGIGNLSVYAAEETKTPQEPKPAAASNQQQQKGTVKLVDVNNYTKMRILRTQGNRTIKLVVEELPIQTFGMSNYELMIDNKSSQEVQGSLPQGRYPAKIYRRHKEYDELLSIRANEVDESSKPKALFIDIKPNAVTVIRCNAQDYGEIKFEVLTEE